MCSRGQVEAVCVVMEHQQTVEVLASCQDPVFVAPPRHWTISEAVNRQRRPGLRLRLLQVTPDLLDESVHVLRKQQSTNGDAESTTHCRLRLGTDQRGQEAAGRVLTADVCVYGSDPLQEAVRVT